MIFKVLEKSKKKNYSKIQSTQKRINKIKKNVQLCRKEYGNLAAILKNLSQLIDLLFLSNSSAIIELKS